MGAQTQGRNEHDLEPDFEFTAPKKVSTASPEVKTAAEGLVYIKRSATKRKDKGKAIMKEERFSSTDPTNDKERTLWVELKRLLEPNIDDILWKLQRYMHDPLTWRLYDTCGIHHVSTDRGHDIFMLVEIKDYTLTRGNFDLMLLLT
ncbi:hypothetical protein Tco_1004600 [Tanacetum coccineum]|uniref:Uncharacterized protein n=1 Tax=Tanacetum coccineum TaxID=301880 RepID=A0ABQ5FCU8_9ASTR